MVIVLDKILGKRRSSHYGIRAGSSLNTIQFIDPKIILKP